MSSEPGEIDGGQASAQWVRRSVEHAWYITHGNVRNFATLTHWLEGTDLEGQWGWQIQPAPDTLGLFGGATGVCATEREAMAELTAEVERLIELVEREHGPNGPPAQQPH